LAAFRPYAGAFTWEGETYRWNCYATCPVYEVRGYAHSLPEPQLGRKWVHKPRTAGDDPEFAVLVDGETTDFSQMLTQIAAAAPAAALAF
jgi:hypothetical protein